MTISTGDFYYFPEDDSIWLVTAISDRVSLTLVADSDTHGTTSLLPEYVHNFSRYLGNTSTTTISQLKSFYPELFL